MNQQLLSAKRAIEKLQKKEYQQSTVQINFILDFKELGDTDSFTIPIIIAPDFANKFLNSIKNRKEFIINE